LEDIGLAVFIAVYWFVSGYVFAWWTPFAVEAGLIGTTIGLSLFAWVHITEGRGGKVPMPLGCALFAPPMTLILVGAIIWVIENVLLF
jgi:heme/copper-type cytochrome/quinol oxidase subunit 4